MEPIITGIIVATGASFVNFLGTKIYNGITGERKNFAWQSSEVDLLKFNSNLEFEELKKRTRIVVIDDEDAFPIKLFETEGYSIDKWDKVENYGKLEKGFYDIIVLDIKGVAKHISEDDGLGVLDSLKRNNPSQIIIAFSQHSFDLSKTKFWELADEKIAKPSDFLKIKKIIDNLIQNQFNPKRYITSLQNLLQENNLSKKEVGQISSLVEKSIVSKKELSKDKLINISKNNIDLVTKIISLTSVILKFFK